MKIIVDEMPKKPKECLFSRWNCEYGFLCSQIKYKLKPCYLVKNMPCPYLKEQAKEGEG